MTKTPAQQEFLSMHPNARVKRISKDGFLHFVILKSSKSKEDSGYGRSKAEAWENALQNEKNHAE